jgi:hypothetical protein
MNKIPVGKTIAYAYSFAFGQLGTIIGLCWLPLVLAAVLQFLPWAFGGNPMAAPGTAAEQGQHALESLASSLLMVLLYAVIYVPVTRQALGLRQGSAMVHFALGPPEFRVFGALLLFFLVLVVMAIGLGMLALIGSGLVAVLGKNPILALILALLVLAAVLGFVYAAIRLGFLLVPVTVAEAQVSLTRAWLLTAHNFWRILGVLVAALGPLYVVHLVGVLVLAGPGLFAPLPADTTAAEQAFQMRFQLLGQHMPEYLGLSLILAPFAIGLSIGAAAFAYRALAPSASASTPAAPANQF